MHTCVCVCVVDWLKKKLKKFYFILSSRFFLFCDIRCKMKGANDRARERREKKKKSSRRRKFFHYPLVVSGVKVPSVCCLHSLPTNEIETRERQREKEGEREKREREMKSVYLKNTVVRVCVCERWFHLHRFLIINYIWLRFNDILTVSTCFRANHHNGVHWN